ncbi:MAG: hypothetical protein JWS12_494 [Candidatus Saccharibacteria bacterium]|nr:hypothetical protein [Candidatus Saccharibacteria bacterium]
MSDPAERSIEPSPVNWDDIRQQATNSIFADRLTMNSDVLTGIDTGVHAVLRLLAGKVVLVEEANRVLAEERADAAHIARDRIRYREALELLESGKGDPLPKSRGELMIRHGWIHEVVDKALSPEPQT